MNIESLLREEIQNEIEILKTMELGTEAYKVTVDGVAKLIDKVVEMDKIDMEREELMVNKDVEMSIKREEIEMERKDRRVKNGIAIAGVVLPVAVTVWGTFKSFKFEEEGTITTIMGRGFVNKLLPKK